MKSVRVIPVSAVHSRVPYGYVFLHIARIRVLHTRVGSLRGAVYVSGLVFRAGLNVAARLLGFAVHDLIFDVQTRVLWREETVLV